MHSLQQTHPELASQWHPTRNGDLKPSMVGAGSNKKVWWKCPKGDDHEWQTTVSNRARRNQGCPCCINKKIIPSTSLASTHPELAAQWHPHKNILNPTDVGCGSGKTVWWKCPKRDDHEWKAKICDRIKKNHGCTICSNRTIVASNCLATTHPELAAEWHPTKNGDLKPTDVGAGSNKEVWWQCPKGDDHEWAIKIVSRAGKKASGCSVCANRTIVPSNCLETIHPEIAAQWHPTKNEGLKPSMVGAASHHKVWWKCPNGDEHEWRARVNDRSKKNGTGCPICSNQKIVSSNCLEATHPELASQWHPTRNGDLKPSMVGAGSNKKVWWKCQKRDEHEWTAKVNDRSKNNGTGCPICSNKKIVPSNSLATTHPKLAAEWHPTKNGELAPSMVGAGSHKKVWWKCPKGDDHEWETTVDGRIVQKVGCLICLNQKIVPSNSLATTHPKIAAEWHPTKNGELTPSMVGAGSQKKVWWKCPKGDDHVWATSILSRGGKRATGCPYCSNKRIIHTNSLEMTHPELAAQWHPTKNGDSKPSMVGPGSHRKVWWKCPKGDDHEWEALINNRTRKGYGCSVCSNRKLISSNSLEFVFPGVAEEWHPQKNGELKPSMVFPKGREKVWWQCTSGHEWKAYIYSRTGANASGCPVCNRGWSAYQVALFVKSLIPHLANLKPSELYVIFQQSGLLINEQKAREFIKSVISKSLPLDTVEQYCDKPELIECLSLSDESISGMLENQIKGLMTEQTLLDNDPEVGELPLIETKDILSKLEHSLMSNLDAEAIEFFIASAVADIWTHVFLDEGKAMQQLDSYECGEYSKKVKDAFLGQFNGAKALRIPEGYSFRKNATLCVPNLMQRFTAFLLKTKKRLGNWSGTGAGKTLSAIIGSRVVEAKLTIICCPNSVVNNWEKNIVLAYPDSRVFSKSLPELFENKLNKYVILNYEFFQQPENEARLKEFINRHQVDLVVIDEIHFAKQRASESISERKRVVSSMLSEIGSNNANLHVLGMSATPVINNLFEGKTLLEMITGIHHEDLKTNATIPNCISLYQKLVTNGLRWVPKYDMTFNLNLVDIDCQDQIEEIRALSQKSSYIELESILTKTKIPLILKHIKRKTVVYTHYLKDILIPLKDAIEADGWKVSIFSGDDKTGLANFIEGDADVLIGTSCLSTGVDGLQSVCDRLIVNSLPWTHAEFEQLKGRIFRQGQQASAVDIIVPLTSTEVHGKTWSWCQSRWERIQYKKSIADAAVDGIIPEGHIRTPAQAYQDVMGWLKRLETNGVHELEKRRIELELSGDVKKAAYKKYGEFSVMNRKLNNTLSSKSHDMFLANPDAWEYYHASYREARKDWPVVPYKEAIKWINERPHLVIADLGCGEALIKKEVDNVVHSFDHVAIDEDVIACDIANLPLEDACIDAAIFSLSLMGTNYMDYLSEAHRCLKLDGHLWIAEATSRYQSMNSLEEKLEKLGFYMLECVERSKFTFLRAIKK